MDKHILYGILFTVIAVIGLALFIFTFFNALRYFKSLLPGSKFLAFLLSIISLAAIGSGSVFAFQNFTWTKPAETQISKDLKASMSSAQKDSKKYNQKVSMKDYLEADTSKLESNYSEKGKTDINSLVGKSDKSKELILRNVGRKITAGDNTTSLLSISGERVNLLDGKNRVLVFLDTSDYSIKQLSLLKEQKSNVELVIIFPTASGSDIEKMFSTNATKIGEMSKNIIVDNDSMSPNSNSSLTFLATGEYKVSVMPSYVFIDSSSVVSLAGSGSVFSSSSETKTFLDKAFSDKSKLYDEIGGKN